jgi:hypothetical protein
MKKNKIKVTLCALMFLVACVKVPITKRKQLNMLPESTLVSMSLTQYHDFLNQHPAVMNTSEAVMVKNVGAKSRVLLPVT